MIDVTNCDIRKLVQEAYMLSKPQGMGFMHFKPGPLTEDEITDIIQCSSGSSIAVYMDYTNGRAVKMTVFKQGDNLSIHDAWFDHSSGDYDLLLQRIGAKRKAAA